MQIRRVMLENYGLYSGRNEFDLMPRVKHGRKRPIVLVGGMNGAGKTTLLDGLRLALYGKAASGFRVSQQKYHTHLRNLMHRSRSSLIQTQWSRIGVEFDLVLRGQRDTYYVERSWESRNANSIEESIEVHKKQAANSEWSVLDDIDPEHWQAFIADIVPQRLSQLFFFDGEKIKDIASDISGGSAIADSIRSLLGLDIVERLKTDLSTYSSRQTKSHSETDVGKEIDRLESEIRTLKSSLFDLRSETIPATETQIEGVRDSIGNLELRLQEEGSSFADARYSYQHQISGLQTRIDELFKQVRIQSEELFPLALCPTIVSDLRLLVEADTQQTENLTIGSELESLQKEIDRKIQDCPPLLDGPAKRALTIVRRTITDRISARTTLSNSRPSLGLSESDAENLLAWLNTAEDTATETIRRLCSDLESCERELHRVNHQLSRAPEQGTLRPLFEDLSSKKRRLGELLARETALGDEAKRLEFAMVVKHREMYRLVEKVRKDKDASHRLMLVGAAQGVLDRYLMRLTEMKVEQLSYKVVHCFNQLAQKEDLVREVLIDPQTFEITLFGRHKSEIPLDDLSSGEKQILAISLLWGLARTSGRPLPVIIDTPLGRLDSQHRMNLVQNYFPHAGHQVILLSTDTEVDQKLFKELQSNISHCYHLIYDNVERRTYPKREYFWKETADA